MIGGRAQQMMRNDDIDCHASIVHWLRWCLSQIYDLDTSTRWGMVDDIECIWFSLRAAAFSFSSLEISFSKVLFLQLWCGDNCPNQLQLRSNGPQTKYKQLSYHSSTNEWSRAAVKRRALCYLSYCWAIMRDVRRAQPLSANKPIWGTLPERPVLDLAAPKKGFGKLCIHRDCFYIDFLFLEYF